MFIFGDIVLMGIRPVLWLGSIVFERAPATATIICIQSKTENMFSDEKKLHFHCVWASVTLFQ